jgi:hypothetical protein
VPRGAVVDIKVEAGGGNGVQRPDSSVMRHVLIQPVRARAFSPLKVRACSNSLTKDEMRSTMSLRPSAWKTSRVSAQGPP